MTNFIPLLKQFTLILVLSVMSLNVAQAVVPAGKQVTGTIMLQGGSNSAIKWSAPSTMSYKVHVLVPKTGTTTNALYRVYPKGKKAGSTLCDSTNAKYPCFEVTIDQTQHQNAWVQLMLNEDAATQWDFSKGKGYVTAVADNLSAAEILIPSTLVRFGNPSIDIAIGKSYQGGIIFYIDNTGEHGLIAAPTDQSNTIQWYNGSYVTTDATGTAVGTGLANTNKIVAAQGAGSYAAQSCADLVIGEYSDWYLPSKDELNLMYQNIGLGAASPLTNVGGFLPYSYYSSSEADSGSAWLQAFNAEGNQYAGYHNTYFPSFVRAVRAF